MKKEKKHSAKQAAESVSGQKQSNKDSFRKTRRVVWIFTAGLILVLMVVSVRNIVIDYYYAFVLRSETISTAMNNIDPLFYTTDEQELLAQLESQWDFYRNSRLRDKVSTQAQDGTALSGHYYDNDSDTTVIVLHRYDGSSEDDFLYAPYFEECNLLMPDARNHGESGGDASTFGALEQYDLVCWLDWLADYAGEQTVILYGEDMGAVTALLASENGLLSDHVAYIIADSPYSSLQDIAKYTMWKWYKIPNVMTSLLGRMTNNMDNGFTVADADVLDNADAGECPVLFLVGENNEYIPAEESLAVYEAWGGEKELILCDSRNGLIYGENTELIQEALNRWTEQYVG
ncbi:MAG: alpha/beta hydrolase [Oscillospiraceae bacterium]|nr:alpha/beta hydrolase [Oscillospiraceae bacterium]